MPEGHTLRRLADDLDRSLRRAAGSGEQPAGPVRRRRGAGRRQPVLGAESAGKHLFIEFPGDRFIHVHLGLIGKFDVRPAPAPAPVGQVRLRLQNETAYADLRGATPVRPGRPRAAATR